MRAAATVMSGTAYIYLCGSTFEVLSGPYSGLRFCYHRGRPTECGLGTFDPVHEALAAWGALIGGASNRGRSGRSGHRGRRRGLVCLLDLLFEGAMASEEEYSIASSVFREADQT